MGILTLDLFENPPQLSATIHTFWVQHVFTAQTAPSGQSELVPQLWSPEHGVLPSTQNPVLSTMEAQTQEPPGPHVVKVLQVWPVQELEEQAPLLQVPVAHVAPHFPQLFGSVFRSTQFPLQVVEQEVPVPDAPVPVPVLEERETPDPVGPIPVVVAVTVEFPKLNDELEPLITEGPVVTVVSGVTVVLSTGPVVVIVTVGPGDVTVTVEPGTVTVTVCPGAAGLVTVTVEPGAVTVTVDPGIVTVTVCTGTVTVTVDPGAVTVTVEGPTPVGQTVTVVSQAKAKEDKRKKIDRSFMMKSGTRNRCKNVRRALLSKIPRVKNE